VDYLIAHEWALSAEDVLWRRTKQGLYITEQQREQLDSYIHRAATRHQSLFTAAGSE
jgi:glycerol-3-phosphate dehydrogenase